MSDVDMKRDLQCPKCGHRSILHVLRAFPRIHEQVDGSLALVHRPGGLATIVTTTGNAEAYVCERCGFIELYAVSPLEVDGINVRRLTPPEFQTYR